jgi:hypothetical protein
VKNESAPNARPETTAAVWLPVADLKPNPRNPRMHGSEVQALARVILRTAWGAPIVAQHRGRRIIGGHGRLEAAKLILRGIEIDGEPRGGADHSFGGPPGCVPVRIVDVGDAEADAMTLADNARGLQGTDDAASLVAMAAGFGRESTLLADMGFDAAMLDSLVKDAGDAVLAAAASGTGNDEAGSPERGKGPDEKADAYEDRAVKRVMIFFDHAGYDDFIRKADALCAVRGVDSYSDLVVGLVNDAAG